MIRNTKRGRKPKIKSPADVPANAPRASVAAEPVTPAAEALRLRWFDPAPSTSLRTGHHGSGQACRPPGDAGFPIVGIGASAGGLAAFATVFVDHQLRILRFTPSATQIINLILSDVGRPLAHVVSNLVGCASLVADVQAVLDTLVPKEVDVQTTEGKWYKLRIQPYRTLDNVIEGAVITFVDITEIVRTRDELRKANEISRLAVVVRDAHDAITVQDLEGRIIAWNQSAMRMYGWSEAEALAMNVRDRIPEGLHREALAKVLQLSRAEILEPHRTQRLAKDGSIVNVSVVSTALVNEAGQMYAIATTERGVGGASDRSDPSGRQGKDPS